MARHSGLTLTYGSSASGWRELGPPQVFGSGDYHHDHDGDIRRSSLCSREKLHHHQAARPLDTVVVEDGVAERLAADCAKFLK